MNNDLKLTDYLSDKNLPALFEKSDPISEQERDNNSNS